MTQLGDRKMFVGGVVVGLALGLLLCGTGHAQMATEIMPGMTYYSGPNGGTIGVELMPGYRHYSGEVQGSSVQTMPGVQFYNLRPSAPAVSNEDAFNRMADGILENRARLRIEHDEWWERMKKGGAR